MDDGETLLGAEAVERNVPEAIRKARAADARREAAALELADEIRDETYSEFGPEVARALARELRHMVLDAGATVTEVRMLRDVFADAVARPPDEATQRGQQAQTWRELRRVYGTRAEEVLAVAQAWCQEDPRRARLLDHPGVGDDQRVVLTVVRLALTAKATAG